MDDPKVAEALRKMEEANQQLAVQKQQQTTPNKVDSPSANNKGTQQDKPNMFSKLLSNLNFRKDDDDDEDDQPQQPLEIGAPVNIVHEGHIGFDKNEGFKVR